jgi:hypothetical protein
MDPPLRNQSSIHDSTTLDQSGDPQSTIRQFFLSIEGLILDQTLR